MSTTHFEMHGKSDGLMEGGRAGRRGGLPAGSRARTQARHSSVLQERFKRIEQRARIRVER